MMVSSMKTTKLFFDSPEMAVLATVIADLVKDLASRGTLIEEERRPEITQLVLKIASRGITDPDEIRLLVLDRFKN
jgi:hypothetical protein